MSSGQVKKVKKLKIVLKKKIAGVVDPYYAEKTSKILEHSIHEIYNHKATKPDSQTLYSNVIDIVLQKCGESLYSCLVSTMTSHVHAMSEPVEAAARNGSLLEELSAKWNDCSRALEHIRRAHKISIRELCLNLWREYVIPSTFTRLTLVDALLERILREREGEPIDRVVMRNVIAMLRDVMGRFFYKECFDRPFLDASEEFYRAESERLIERCRDRWEYLREAERRIDEERDRVSHYLDAEGLSEATRVVEKEMIENHTHGLVGTLDPSVLVKMLSDDEFEDIGRIFRLFRQVPNGLSTIRDAMLSNVRDFGRSDVLDPERSEDPIRFVEALIEKRDRYDKIVREAFNCDEAFDKALNSSFGSIVNLNPRCPEYVSLFIDDKLRKGLKVMGEAEIEEALDKVAVLIRYIHERDVFEKYYRQHLAKRLLSGNALSEDAERSLIAKLKPLCGHQFTLKLEAMLADMKASRDTMRGFHESEHGPPALVVRVLKTGSWPAKPGPPCKLPSELSSQCGKFESYYVGTHAGPRKLSWQTNMGSAEITASFANGQSYELGVSTYQMCVLMLFNDSDLLTYEEIERATEIPSDLKRCLHPLACVEGKNVLLRKEPVSTDKIGEGDVFYVNDRFTSEHRKVKIGTVAAPQMEFEPEKRETRQRVEEDRKPQMDSAIVRIMKFRRVLDHKGVIAEVAKELQPLFIANPPQIKKRIESLIERDFLERDNVDRSLYRYVA